MTGNFIHYTLVATLIVLAVLLLNPFHFWMPTMLHMMAIGALVAAGGLLGAFVVRERSSDERESLHRMYAARAGFLAGAGVLVVAIAEQSLRDTLDPWLVVALVSMVVAKIFMHAYSDRFL